MSGVKRFYKQGGIALERCGSRATRVDDRRRQLCDSSNAPPRLRIERDQPERSSA
ncbi:MAG: hypothetical protein WKF84_00710 [Pyrinomonadaceae bacterium]